MRIRKNAKLSSLLSSNAPPLGAPLPLRVCPLNQSPWDVVPFSFPDALAPSSSLAQLDGGKDSFTADGSLGNSIGAVESSEASMMVADTKKKTVIDNKLKGHTFYNITKEDRMNINSYEATNGGDSDGDFSFKLCCNKTDSKWSQCKNEAVEGHYLCEHHLSRLKSYISTADGEDNTNADDSASRKLDKSSTSTGHCSGQPRGAKNSSSSVAAKSNQFYYYSGFGPSWGKKRRRGSRGSRRLTPLQISGKGIDYVVYDIDDEDDTDDDKDSRKKRMRKPVKGRSLKSLM
ncbi:hypothetical protein ACJRO7_034569 [Eucalyptus globulus]|uniref:WRC domain-containing protein n=1 Tax=Eucalyptus globulus TaxID=34317 RepID=A0ABD3J771_EUCGL